MRWPDYQYEFGQGLPSNIGPAGSIYEGQPYYSYGKAEDGSYASTSGTSSAYGARFDANRLFYQYDPVTQGRASVATPWVAYKNNRKDLFQTGYTLTNSVALTGKSDRGSVRASITHTKNEWILPNTGFQRITAMVSAQQQIRGHCALISSRVIRTASSTTRLHWDITVTLSPTSLSSRIRMSTSTGCVRCGVPDRKM